MSNNTHSHDSNVPWGDYLDDYSMQEKIKKIQNIRDPDARRMAKIMHENEERERIRRRKKEEEERLAREREQQDQQGGSQVPPAFLPLVPPVVPVVPVVPGLPGPPEPLAPPASITRPPKRRKTRLSSRGLKISASTASILVGMDPNVRPVVPAIPLPPPGIPGIPLAPPAVPAIPLPPPGIPASAIPLPQPASPNPPPKPSRSLELYDSDPWFWLYIPTITHGVPAGKLRVFVLGEPEHRQTDLRLGQLLHSLTPYSLDQDSGLRIPYPPRLREITANSHYNLDLYEPNYSTFLIDWIDPSVNQGNNITRYNEIGSELLMHICEQAELKDMEFARNMQGLLGTNASYTWACLQPDFDPSDRHTMLNLYIHSKVQSTLVNVDLTTVDPPDVAHEMIRQYKTFNQEWAKLHYKNITPVITSHCETLVEKCIQAIPSHLHWLPRIYLARALWRCDDTRTPWQNALYWHITEYEQNRGGRNPSYKQMNNSLNQYAQSYYALIRCINQTNWNVMIPNQSAKMIITRLFTIDWHSIVGQLPYVHKKFQSMRSYNAMEYGAQTQKMQGVGGSRWRYAPGEVPAGQQDDSGGEDSD